MWTIKSDERLELHDEEEDEVIAILLWDERALNWKLYYRYAGGSGYANPTVTSRYYAQISPEAMRDVRRRTA